MSGAALVAVRVTPRGGTDAIEGVDGAGALRIRVAAAPADGAANVALTRLLAKTLGLPRRAVTVTSGTSSRHKRLRIEGVTAAALGSRWPGVSSWDE